MTLDTFLKKANSDEKISFAETMAVIDNHYQYQPTQFFNGLGNNRISNEAGSNEGSCKIFAFARLHHFNKQQTLKLFGDYYWIDVLNNPQGSDHQNIRNFIKFGWDGIEFDQKALSS